MPEKTLTIYSKTTSTLKRLKGRSLMQNFKRTLKRKPPSERKKMTSFVTQ